MITDWSHFLPLVQKLSTILSTERIQAELSSVTWWLSGHGFA